MKKPLVYIAGPIYGSGTPNGNLRRALDAAEKLMEAGAIPFVPHLFLTWEQIHFHEGNQEFWMEMDFAWLAKCNAIVRLDGNSPGADREVEFAREHNIPVFTAEDLTGAARGRDSAVHRFIGALESGRFIHHLISEELPPPVEPEPEYTTSVQRMQSAVADWIQRQPFGPDQQPHQPLLGMSEELGELCHAHLKNEQGIRGMNNHKADELKKDALGDLFIYMCGYAEANGIDLWQAIKGAWSEVSERDWNENSHDGSVSTAAPIAVAPSYYSDKSRMQSRIESLADDKRTYIVEEHGD